MYSVHVFGQPEHAEGEIATKDTLVYKDALFFAATWANEGYEVLVYRGDIAMLSDEWQLDARDFGYLS